MRGSIWQKNDLKNMPDPLIFSDLDGTLFNYPDYSFKVAARALEEIRKHDITLILNSSKTKDEFVRIRAALQNHHPFIVENGTAVLIP